MDFHGFSTFQDGFLSSRLVFHSSRSFFIVTGRFHDFFKIPGWFSWFQAFLYGFLRIQVGFSSFQVCSNGFSWFQVGFFMVPGWFFMVPCWFFMVPGGGLWFQVVLWFQVGFYYSTQFFMALGEFS